VSDNGSFVAPLAGDGDAMTGVGGGGGTVMKLHAPDHALVPPTFVAFTSQ
jgi:hypothetical protein